MALAGSIKLIGGLKVMAITRIWIEEGCNSCRMLENNCPEVFKVKDRGSTVIDGVGYSGLEEKIKEAAKLCPVEVIKYDEDDDPRYAPSTINRN